MTAPSGLYERLFQDFAPGEAEKVLARGAPRVLRRGEVLFREGEPADALYLLSRVRELATEPVAQRLARTLLRLGQQIGRREQGTPLIALSRVAVPRQTWWLRAAKELLGAGADPTVPSWPNSDSSAWAIANAVWNDR